MSHPRHQDIDRIVEALLDGSLGRPVRGLSRAEREEVLRACMTTGDPTRLRAKLAMILMDGSVLPTFAAWEQAERRHLYASNILALADLLERRGEA